MVGIGDDFDADTCLDQMALAGKMTTAKEAPFYYRATDPTQLTTLLTAIIAEVAKGLAAQGHTLREPGGTGRSAEGYLTATLDPASALGFPFQVAEG